MQKKLYRSRSSRVFGGVAGGFAEYFGIDVVIFRLLFVFLLFADGIGVLAYIVLWIVVPEGYPVYGSGTGADTESGKKNLENEYNSSTDNGKGRYIFGFILVGIGAVLLLNKMFYFDLADLFPIALIIAGVILLTGSYHHKEAEENGKS